MMSSTGSWALNRKFSAKRITVISSSTSHSPRVARYRDSSATEPPRLSRRAAARPARNTKPGAQTWVIQRVRNRIGVVRARSSAWKTMASAWKNSRTWSSAMIAITSPRTASRLVIRASARVIAGHATNLRGGDVENRRRLRPTDERGPAPRR